jgi:hypothetical protein
MAPSATIDEARFRGRELYDFIRRERPVECLELGFAHGVSTVYIAAGLEANCAGHLTNWYLHRRIRERWTSSSSPAAGCCSTT